MNLKWRLGLDVGSSSLGWAVIRLNASNEPTELEKAGVRIFSDGRNPKDKQSNAVQRRIPRGMRRTRDRKLDRRDDFLAALIEYGLMPQDQTARKALENPVGKNQNKSVESRMSFDPWCLRVRGLDAPLSLHEFGRALFHLQQRRGFQSNRKTDKAGSDKGKIAEATQKTLDDMSDKKARTLGELFGRPRLEGDVHASTRARLHGEGAKAYYNFYPTRALILAEFDILWETQAKHHPDILTQTARDDLRGILKFQRDLKPQPVGRCTFEPDDLRAPWALPSSQRRRVFETINNLRYREPGEAACDLSLEQRDILVGKALSQKALTFGTMRKLLGFHDDVTFSIESEKRKQIEGDHAAALLAKTGKSALWGKDWRALTPVAQEAIVEILLGLAPVTEQTTDANARMSEGVVAKVSKALGLDEREAEHWLTETDPEKMAGWLSQRFELDSEIALRIVNVPLPDGHQSLGRSTNARILAALEARVITYDKAVLAAGYKDHRAVEGHGEVHDVKLPYYGEVLERSVAFGTGKMDDILERRVGKLANPTVHVSLNQIRKTVNALMKRYGAPEQVVIELARDLPMSAQGKNELEAEQKKHQDANDARRVTLASHNAPDNYSNRLKLRLYDELPEQRKVCILSGEPINITALLSEKIEIDHILPFALTLDDGFGNKMLVTRQANREKARNSPHAAFSHSPLGYNWMDIAGRAADLPANKSWRFGPDAMERYEDEERGFLERQLNDTKYIARLTRTYLGAIFGGGDEAMKHVWVTPGRLTSDLRSVWGLNSVLSGHNKPDDEDAPVRKNRDDHRHHAVDAVVIALTDRATLKRAADHAKQQNLEISSARLLARLGTPWDGFREDVKRVIQSITVSHKKEHGLAGALHEDTAYGVVVDPRSGQERLAARKPITGLTPGEIDKIGDRKIREDLLEATQGKSGKDFKDALQEYVDTHRHRRVRIHKAEADYRTIHHGLNKQHKKALIPGENYCMDIFQTLDGKWRGAGISRFDANQGKGALSKNFVPRWRSDYPDAELVMRVRKKDLIAVEDVAGMRRIMRVVKLSPSNNTLSLVEHFEAGKLQPRHEDDTDLFRWDFANISKLKGRSARLVHVDAAGRVFDSGPHDAGTNS